MKDIREGAVDVSAHYEDQTNCPLDVREINIKAPLPKYRPWKTRLKIFLWTKLFWFTQRIYFFSRWLNHCVGFKCWAFVTKPLPWFNYWKRVTKRIPQQQDNFSALIVDESQPTETPKPKES